jgi:hypothetical protein
MVATLEEQVMALQEQLAATQLQLTALGRRVIALEDAAQLAQINLNRMSVRAG